MQHSTSMRRHHSTHSAKLGSPILRGYRSTHGTPIISIKLDHTPKASYERFQPLASPTYSDDEDSEGPSPLSSPIRPEAPPLYHSLRLEALENRLETPTGHDIPLIPIKSPKVGSVMTITLQRKSSIIPLPSVRVPHTLPFWRTDLKRTVATQIGRRGTMRRIVLWTLLFCAFCFSSHALTSAYLLHIQQSRSQSVPGSIRARTLLGQDATRHAGIGQDKPNIHFAGSDAHRGRVDVTPKPDARGQHFISSEEPLRSYRDLPKGRMGMPLSGVGQPERSRKQDLGRVSARTANTDARAWSAEAAIRATEARLGLVRNDKKQLAGGLAYPGLLEARRAAAEAYKWAVMRGVSDSAEKAAVDVIQAIRNDPRIRTPEEAIIRRPATPPRFEGVRRLRVSQSRDNDSLRSVPHALTGDMADKKVPRIDAKDLPLRAAGLREQNPKLPLRLAKFGDERFSRD